MCMCMLPTLTLERSRGSENRATLETILLFDDVPVVSSTAVVLGANDFPYLRLQ